MYDPEVVEKLGLKPGFRKTQKALKKIHDWESENQRSAYLTWCCVTSGCGHVVIFEKVGNHTYQYRCPGCGYLNKVSETDGKAILGF